MPGNDAVLFFSETRVVEVKEIIMSGVFLADAVGALWRAFHGLRLGIAGASENTQVWSGHSTEHQPRKHAQLVTLACRAAPNFTFCFHFFFFFLSPRQLLLPPGKWKRPGCHSFVRLQLWLALPHLLHVLWVRGCLL